MLAKSKQRRAVETSKWSVHSHLHTKNSHWTSWDHWDVLKASKQTNHDLGPFQKVYHCRRLEASGIAASQNPTPWETPKQVYNDRHSVVEPYWKVCSQRVQSGAICWQEHKPKWPTVLNMMIGLLENHNLKNLQTIATSTKCPASHPPWASQPIWAHDNTQSQTPIRLTHSISWWATPLLIASSQAVEWNTKIMFNSDKMSSALAWQPRALQDCGNTIRMTSHAGYLN